MHWIKLPSSGRLINLDHVQNVYPSHGGRGGVLVEMVGDTSSDQVGLDRLAGDDALALVGAIEATIRVRFAVLMRAFDGRDFDLDDRVTLMPAALEADAVAPRVDGLSDAEIAESAAYEAFRDVADEDGFVPASALGAMREAARAQAFAGTDAVAIDNEVS